jgi:hypothetical protein
MLAALALALLQPATAPAPPQERRQEGGNIMGPYEGVQERQGPLHFCAGHVAIDVAADEKIGWQEGPDFDLYFLRSSRGGFGLYQGMYPDTYENTREPAQVGGLPAERLRDSQGHHSYLIPVPRSGERTDVPQIIIHLYGDVWQGDARDDALLARVHIGQPAALGCEHPTFQR